MTAFDAVGLAAIAFAAATLAFTGTYPTPQPHGRIGKRSAAGSLQSASVVARFLFGLQCIGLAAECSCQVGEVLSDFSICRASRHELCLVRLLKEKLDRKSVV